jgi:hypothetical protein
MNTPFLLPAESPGYRTAATGTLGSLGSWPERQFTQLGHC